MPSIKVGPEVTLAKKLLATMEIKSRKGLELAPLHKAAASFIWGTKKGAPYALTLESLKLLSQENETIPASKANELLGNLLGTIVSEIISNPQINRTAKLGTIAKALKSFSQREKYSKKLRNAAAKYYALKPQRYSKPQKVKVYIPTMVEKTEPPVIETSLPLTQDLPLIIAPTQPTVSAPLDLLNAINALNHGADEALYHVTQASLSFFNEHQRASSSDAANLAAKGIYLVIQTAAENHGYSTTQQADIQEAFADFVTNPKTHPLPRAAAQHVLDGIVYTQNFEQHLDLPEDGPSLTKTYSHESPTKHDDNSVAFQTANTTTGTVDKKELGRQLWSGSSLARIFDGDLDREAPVFNRDTTISKAKHAAAHARTLAALGQSTQAPIASSMDVYLRNIAKPSKPTPQRGYDYI